MQTDGRNNGKADAGNELLVTAPFSWKFKLDEQSLKARLLERLSSGEAEVYMLNLGCFAGSLVVNCGRRTQLEHPALTGRPEIDSDSSSGQQMEVSTKYLSATGRTSLARILLYFGERFGLVAMVVASRVARMASNTVKCAACTSMHKTTPDALLSSSLLVDLLACVLGEGHFDIGLLVREVQGQDRLEDAEGWRRQPCEAQVAVSGCRPIKCRSHQAAELAQGVSPRKTDVGDLRCESQRSLWVECKENFSEVVPTSHTPTTLESKN